MKWLLAVLLILTGGLATSLQLESSVRFVILGDRTGEAQTGVYEQIWKETAAEHPDFVINVGDTIQGGDDTVVDSEWRNIERILKPFSRLRFYYTPGNHDVWDDLSAREYVKFSKRPLHYGFDFAMVHISVLDNSRTEDLPESELNWLEKDLEAHRNTPVKFVFSHRPSWVLYTVLQNPDFPLQRIAKKYGARYVVAGHIHQMLHFELDGVSYASMASSGGHLRNSRRYQDGWFFQHTVVTVHGTEADFEIKETKSPYGEARVSHLNDWGAAGLIAGPHS